ncbi:hypothetical protein SDC9_183830 [bioreactor metagenome]|uniref:Uncharacterized protein n=1 Tax=bioreactor metagenome TaxID=1076179 RepID=A0A645HBA2_9ZZZZ
MPAAVPSTSMLSSRCSACSCMPASISRRSRLKLSSCCAMVRARAGSSVSRHSTPRRMSARRPAALRRGPSRKPRSKAVARFGSRPAALNRAAMPGCICPARMRLRPWLTRMRLLRSSLTTSATVPSATRSSRSAKLGSGRSVK